jgi:hypothetical protein
MFVINTENDPPSVSTLVAPLNGSIQTDLTPNFYWTEAVDNEKDRCLEEARKIVCSK